MKGMVVGAAQLLCKLSRKGVGACSPASAVSVPHPCGADLHSSLQDTGLPDPGGGAVLLRGGGIG